MRIANCLRRMARRVMLPACLTVALAAATQGASASAATTLPGLTMPGINRHAALSWGVNGTGQLGVGTFTARSLPGPVEELGRDVVQVATGQEFALALRSDGTVWAWGATATGSWATARRVTGSSRPSR